MVKSIAFLLSLSRCWLLLWLRRAEEPGGNAQLLVDLLSGEVNAVEEARDEEQVQERMAEAQPITDLIGDDGEEQLQDDEDGDVVPGQLVVATRPITRLRPVVANPLIQRTRHRGE